MSVIKVDLCKMLLLLAASPLAGHRLQKSHWGAGVDLFLHFLSFPFFPRLPFPCCIALFMFCNNCSIDLHLFFVFQ